MYDFLDQMSRRQRWNFYFLTVMYTIYITFIISLIVAENTILPRAFMMVAVIPALLEVVYFANYQINYVLRCRSCGSNVTTGLADESFLDSPLNYLWWYYIPFGRVKPLWRYWFTKHTLDFPESCANCDEPYEIKTHMEGILGWLLDSRGILFVLGAFLLFGFGMIVISILTLLLFRFL